MQIHLTPPLVVKTALGTRLELMPVHMQDPKPSSVPDRWLRFLKTEGKRIPISPTEAERCQRYMRQHETEALSEDAETAYTIAGNALVECLPDALAQDNSCEA